MKLKNLPEVNKSFFKNNIMLYPLKFTPIYKEKIWGGSRIKKLKNDESISDKCGESWEVSSVQGDLSVVSDGPLKGNNIQELAEVYMSDLLGDKVFKKYGIEFPLLVKIIDASENLSVQVHPDDDFAKQQHNAYGKPEAWYVLDAKKDAKIILGFNKSTSQVELIEKLKKNEVLDLVNFFNVQQGSVYEIPPGRIHATGKGILLLEVQQTSDITYRVYDYNRKDNRELHIDLATEVLDYTKTEKAPIKFSRKPDISNPILSNTYFNMNFLPVMNSAIKDYGMIDSFIIYYCINGKVGFEYDNSKYTIEKGETILIPASINSIKLVPSIYSELIEIYC